MSIHRKIKSLFTRFLPVPARTFHKTMHEIAEKNNKNHESVMNALVDMNHLIASEINRSVAETRIMIHESEQIIVETRNATMHIKWAVDEIHKTADVIVNDTIKTRRTVDEIRETTTPEGLIQQHKRSREIVQKINDYHRVGDESIINGLVYNDLSCIYNTLGASIYELVVKKLFEQNERNLSKRSVIKVGFIYTVPYTWSFDSLYWYMEEHEHYEPYVIVMPPNFDMGEICNYGNNLQTVRDKGYRYVESFDLENNRYRHFDLLNELGIIFHQVPYEHYPRPYRVRDIPLSTLNVLVMYAILLVENRPEWFFKSATQRCMWKIVCENDFLYEYYRSKFEMGKLNTIRCGIPMMDVVFDKKVSLERNQKNKKYSIIWAPGYQVKKVDGKPAVATFDMNKDFFLEYAAKHSETYWYVRPHPQLLVRGVEQGHFSNDSEWHSYFSKWSVLDNAELAFNMDVTDLFELSDMLIADFGSLLVDYLFYKKPVLRLKREKKDEPLNELGSSLLRNIPVAQGGDFKTIEKFIITKPRVECDDFFENHLNYYKQNGNKTAAEYLVEHIEDTFKDANVD